MKIFKNKTYKYSFFYIILLNFLNKPVSAELEPLLKVVSIFFLLSLLALSSFISLLTIYISLYLNSKYKIEDKFNNYPFIIKIINYSIKASKMFILIDSIVCFISILGIFIFAVLILGIPFIV